LAACLANNCFHILIIGLNMGLSKYSVVNSDVIEWSKVYDGPKFHALMTDAPYHLASIQKRFGKPSSAPAKGGVYRRSSAGFMGSDWDKVDEDGLGIAFRPETWSALAQHLYPGAFIMAFAGTRGYHRMAVAMEDAGLIIHPAIGFLFLSGFPKATRIDTQIQKMNNEPMGDGLPLVSSRGTKGQTVALGGSWQDNPKEKIPTIPLAQSWQGYRYGLQALKPAFEFIAVAQVPYQGRPVDNITQTGAGALNIDGGRIGTGDSYHYDRKGGNSGDVSWSGLNVEVSADSHPQGRWPANFLLHHNSGCLPEQCEESCAVAMLDRQSGILTSGGADGHRQATGRDDWGMNAKHDHTTQGGLQPDSGPASRMFFRAEWNYETAEALANADPVHYQPKASTAEREVGLADLETKTRHRVNAGGLENEPRFAPTQVKNNHPCVKSISLTKYLATLLLPPIEYAPRRILIPFCGVGSEICGALLSGWEEIVGIEMSAEYCKIAEARVKYWDSVKDKVRLYGLDAILQKYGKQDKETSDLQLRLPF
jgi:site-specific DNA-methyltransferase (adenine-specific)